MATSTDTSPSKGILARILGKKKNDEDIELPNESGRTDKRLPKKKVSKLDEMKSGFKIFKNLGKESK